MRFLLLEGQHKDTATKKSYKKGDIVESLRPLDTLFRNKFQQISEDGLAVPPENPVAIPGLDEENVQPQIDPLCLEHGTEIMDFPQANKMGMRIFHKKGHYIVVDTDDGSVINQKKLSWRRLESFVDDLVNEDQSGGGSE